MRRFLALLAIAATLVSGAVVASAASVGPVSGSLFAATGAVTNPAATRSVTNLVLTKTGAPETVTAMTITITGSGLAELAGQQLSVAVLDANAVQVNATTVTLVSGSNLIVGATTATVTVPVTGSPLASTYVSWAVFISGVQVLGPAADPTKRMVTVGNGVLPASPTLTAWQQALVPTVGQFTVLSAVSLTTATTVQQCIAITITGTQSNANQWTVVIDYSKPPFYGQLPTVDGRAIVTSTTATTLTLTGTSNGTGSFDEWTNNSRLTRNRQLTFTVCQYNANTAPNRTEAYTLSAQTQGTWTTEQACVRRTVTGNGTYPFSFGWSVPLDLTAAIAQLRATDPGAPRALVFQPSVVTPGTYTNGVTSYTVTNARDTAIAGTESRVVELCVSRY